MSKTAEQIEALAKVVKQAQSYSKSIKRIDIVWVSPFTQDDTEWDDVEVEGKESELKPNITIEYYE